MLAIERKNIIYARLCSEGKVMVNDLAAEFGVSDETIRRDLDKLQKEGLAEKFYGGAIKAENTFHDLPFHVRQNSNIGEKKDIADKALRLIKDNSYIAVDSSTTALEVMKAAHTCRNLNVITNSVEILLEFSQKPDWNIICTGGNLRTGSLSLVGNIAANVLSEFNVDLCICSSKGLDVEKGCTESTESEASMKSAFIKSAKHKLLVADHSKFNRISFAKVCDITEFDTIVTDITPSEEWLEFCQAENINLIY